MRVLTLVVGLRAAALDIAPWFGRTLTRNVVKRCVCVGLGLTGLALIAPQWLSLSWDALRAGILTGLTVLVLQVVVGGGVHLRRSDLSPGLLRTSALIYLLELPSEEFLYRGLIFSGALQLWGLGPALAISTAAFIALHLATWRDARVWVGAACLGLLCALIVHSAGSIWAGIIVHDLNNLGFLTLVNRRNIFPDAQSSIKSRT